jgi:hypothetical protein
MLDLSIEAIHAQRKKEVPNKSKAKGKDMEALLFPHLYPKSTGYWVDGKGDAARSFEEDMNIKLQSHDPRWRDDPEWPTWAAARNIGGPTAGLDPLFT